MPKTPELDWQLRLRGHNKLLIQFIEIAKHAPFLQEKLVELALRIAALEEQYQQDQIRLDAERNEWIETTFRGQFEQRRRSVQQLQEELDIVIFSEYDSPHTLTGVRYKVRQ